MSYLALYRKYRPSTFEEVIGQDIVIKILRNSIDSGKISHAYLFSGPRGTGKTTTAKLIAKLINCSNRINNLPCNNCASCLAVNEKNNPDIIEMDAASNNGVDEIREIRDKVSLMPTVSKYKIYIIDEVHMLSTGAFNALLKTLEEPPQHVIFILATTEFYKVPETIVSRCQCFNFERISVDNIVKELSYIVDKENIKIESEVLPLIAKYSDGGLRDAVNMLDKLYCCSNDIKVNDFYELKGLINKEEFKNIVDYIFNKDINNMLDSIDFACNNGKNIILFAEELLEFVKDMLVDQMINNSDVYNSDILYNFVDILNDVIDKMKNSSNPKIILEVGLLKIVNLFKDDKIISREIILEKKWDDKSKNDINSVNNSKEIINDVNQNMIVDTQKNNSKSLGISENVIVNKSNMSDKNRKIRINNAFATANKDLLEDLKICWVNFSDYLHNKEFSSVVSYLIDGNLRVAGDKYLIISVRYDSILENAMKCLDKIELLFNLVSGKMYKITFILDDEWNSLKNKYIEDRKNGIVYQLLDEIEENNDIINNNVTDNDVSPVLNDAISLFGNDLIEVK